jgi:hypothetical protein
VAGRRGRPPVALAVAFVLPIVLLVVSVQLGLSALGSRRIALQGSSLDTSTAQGPRIGTIAPLSASYVDSLLGAAPTAGLATTRILPATTAATGSDAPAVRAVSLAPGSNDEFDHAFPVSTMPFTAATNTTGATRERGESNACSAVVGTVWFRARLPVSVPLTVSTFGSSYTAITGVYAAADDGSLRPVACVRTIGDFTAAAGTTYYFQVAGTGGSLLFHLVEAQRLSHLALDSLASDGHQSIVGNDGETISANGRYLVWNSGDESLAGGSELDTLLADVGYVPHQTCTKLGKPHPDYALDEPTHTDVRPDCQVIYERDLATGRNVAVGFGYQPVESADGRYVAFTGSNGQYDAQVFEVDLRTHHRWLVSHRLGNARLEGTAPGPDHAQAWHPVMTPDGRYVAFASSESDLVRGDDNGTVDGFVWDRVTGKIRRITTASTGSEQDNGGPRNSIETGVVQCLSADGRYAVFSSPASNLSSDNPYGVPNVYRKDLRSGRLALIGVGLAGRADGPSPAPGHLSGHCISANGRFVLFPSYAGNLVRGDTNRSLDFFVRDVVKGTTVRVNVSSTGAQAVADYGRCLYGLSDATTVHVSCSQTDFSCSITPSGRYVGFTSIADNLVADDVNGFADVFRRDLLTGETVRVSTQGWGNVADQTNDLTEQAEGGDSTGGDLSADGRTVVFHSFASNLVVGDANGAADAFAAQFPLPRLPVGALLGAAPPGSTGTPSAPVAAGLPLGPSASGRPARPGQKRVTVAGAAAVGDPLSVVGLSFSGAPGRTSDSGGGGIDPFLLLLLGMPIAVIVTVLSAARRRPAAANEGPEF